MPDSTTRDGNRITRSGAYDDSALEQLKCAIRKLVAYCQAHNWAGYDPYDALNSPIFQSVRFLQRRIPRIAMTQLLRRSPVNLRPVLGIPPTQNAKALALFLSAFLKLKPTGMADKNDFAELLIGRIAALRQDHSPYSCWGYCFPWQGRTVLVPAGAPNLVCTCFVAASLLDAYDQGYDSCCLDMAASACRYIRNELYWEDGEAAGFSYPLPGLRSETHNANLLAAALLCNLYRHTGEQPFLAAALRASRYAIRKQQPDGSWYYGEAASQRWIDNFHTGYNLCALSAVARCVRTDEFDNSIKRGLNFYLDHFFRRDGAPRYFHDRTYPIDIHCAAQSIITLAELQGFDPQTGSVATDVFRWVMKHMWDERGFFYYRVLRLGTIRTSYMRWSQAWMFLALCTLAYQSAQTSQPQVPELAATFE